MTTFKSTRVLFGAMALACCVAAAPAPAASHGGIPLGTLRVTVEQARNLAREDGILGRNDACVSVKADRAAHKTRVLHDTGSHGGE